RRRARPRARVRARGRRLHLQTLLVPGAPGPPRGPAAPRRPPPADRPIARRRARHRPAGADRAPARRGARPVPEGVRAAAHARQRAGAGVHEGGAPASDLGLPPSRHLADAGLARPPVAPQARRPRRPVRRERVGDRLPPRRRAGVVMSAAVVWAWLVAAAAVTAAALAWRELRRGRELVARACHELRGPLTAAHLALHASDGPGARLAAIDLELQRAGLALDDLAAARTGRQAADRAEIVDVGELLAYQAATWEAIAPVFGCELRI